MDLFNNPLVAINRDDTRTLMADWSASIGGVRVTVPMGFTTDGASIPRLLWRLCGHPFEAPRIYAAIRHDWHYSGGDPSVNRKDADRIYRSDMLALGVGPWKARVEYLALRLCGRSHWKTKTKGKAEMKKLMFAALCAGLAVIMTGCTSSTKIEWGGKTAVRQPDGTVLVDEKGLPLYESEKNVYEDSNWLTKREERDVHVKVGADGSYEAGIGSRVNDVSTNGIRMVTGGVDAMTKLVSTCAAAYVTIAGGGAQADTVTSVVTKMIGYFTDRGGDESKAKVSVDEANKKVKISDGSTCVECTADGVCTDCQVPAAK